METFTLHQITGSEHTDQAWRWFDWGGGGTYLSNATKVNQNALHVATLAVPRQDEILVVITRHDICPPNNADFRRPGMLTIWSGQATA